jgi:uncharacterized membrane protein
MGTAMEILLLFALGGGLAWLWNRMEALERRVLELEGAAYAPTYREDSLPWPDPAPPQAQPEAELQGTSAPSIPTDERWPPAPHEREPEESEPDSSVGLGYRFRPSFDFEEVFGRLLPIWGGGIALAIAGFFLVRWSIEMGMLTQSVRVAMGFAFGTLLLGAAELAYRFEHRLSDERVRQALAGAGLATLYASFYLAGTHYGLIGPAPAFAGLAGVTALAIGLSYRFGLPSAVLGLVGGFAAPALVGSPDPNLPLLATYLALVTGGLTVTGSRQRHSWLGLSALAAALGWGVLMLVSGPLDIGGILAIGGYLGVVGATLPALLGAGPLVTIGRIAAAGLASAQIAALVDQSGYSLLAWGCYLLLGAAIAILGLRFMRLREAGAVAAGLSIWLLAAWPDAPPGWFALIAAAHALIFAAVPLFHVWREQAGPVDWGQLALYPVALVGAACVCLGVPLLDGQDLPVSLGAAALATLPALAVWRAWPVPEDRFAPGPFAAVSSAAVMAMLAGLLALPGWMAPLVTALVSLTVFLLLRGRTDTAPRAVHWAIAVSGVVLLPVTTNWQEIELLVGELAAPPQWRYALRWLGAAVPFGLVLADRPGRRARRVGEVIATLLGYGGVAMIVPGVWLPVAIAIAMLVLARRLPDRASASLTLLVLGVLWADGPLAAWIGAGLAALGGDPVLLGDLPSFAAVLRYVAPIAVGLGGALVLGADAFTRYRRASGLAAAFLAIVVVHVGYKQVFAIADMARFVELGFAERTVWQALLALAAFGLARIPNKPADRALAGTLLAVAALGHFVLFSLILHNPLLVGQAVGGWPIGNLLLPAYGIAIALLLWLPRRLSGGPGVRPAFDACVMVLLAMLALSELRQAFSGSVLLAPIGQQEDLLRSILAIAVALGFLGWGSWSGQRSWRIGSLALMLLAVFKVFVFDAAGLEGLARIASFFALGICLIGIGWFYSRQLVVGRTATADVRAENAA